MTANGLMAVHCACCGVKVCFVTPEGHLFLTAKHRSGRHDTVIRLDDLKEAWEANRG